MIYSGCGAGSKKDQEGFGIGRASGQMYCFRWCGEGTVIKSDVDGNGSRCSTVRTVHGVMLMMQCFFNQ